MAENDATIDALKALDREALGSLIESLNAQLDEADHFVLPEDGDIPTELYTNIMENGDATIVAQALSAASNPPAPTEDPLPEDQPLTLEDYDSIPPIYIQDIRGTFELGALDEPMTVGLRDSIKEHLRQSLSEPSQSNITTQDGQTYSFDRAGRVYEVDASGRVISIENPPNGFDPERPHPATVALLENLIDTQEAELRALKRLHVGALDDRQNAAADGFIARNPDLADELAEVRDDMANHQPREAFLQSAAAQRLRQAAGSQQENDINTLLMLLYDAERDKSSLSSEMRALDLSIGRSEAVLNLFRHMLGSPDYNPDARAQMRDSVYMDDVFFSERMYTTFRYWQPGTDMQLGNLYDAGMDAQEERMLAYFGSDDAPARPDMLISRAQAYEYATAQYYLDGITALSKGEKVPEGYDRASLEQFFSENQDLINALPSAIAGDYTDPVSGETIHFTPYHKDLKLAYLGMTERPGLDNPDVRRQIADMTINDNMRLPGNYFMNRMNEDEQRDVLMLGAGLITDRQIEDAAFQVEALARLNFYYNPFEKTTLTDPVITHPDVTANFKGTVTRIKEAIADLGNEGLTETQRFEKFEALNDAEKVAVFQALGRETHYEIDHPAYERTVLNFYEKYLGNYGFQRGLQLAEQGQDLTMDQKLHVIVHNAGWDLEEDLGGADISIFYKGFEPGTGLNLDLTYDAFMDNPDYSQAQKDYITAQINNLGNLTIVDYVMITLDEYNDRRAGVYFDQQREMALRSQPETVVEPDDPAPPGGDGGDEPEGVVEEGGPGDDGGPGDEVVDPASLDPHDYSLREIFDPDTGLNSELALGGLAVDYALARDFVRRRAASNGESLREAADPVFGDKPSDTAARGTDIDVAQQTGLDGNVGAQATSSSPQSVTENSARDLQASGQPSRADVVEGGTHSTDGANSRAGSTFSDAAEEVTGSATRNPKETIRRALARAESTEFQGERDAALNRVQALMDRHGISFDDLGIDEQHLENIRNGNINSGQSQTNANSSSRTSSPASSANEGTSHNFNATSGASADTPKLEGAVDPSVMEDIAEAIPPGWLSEILSGIGKAFKTLGKGALSYLPAIGTAAGGGIALAEVSYLDESRLPLMQDLGLLPEDAVNEIHVQYGAFVAAGAVDPTIVGGEFAIRAMLDGIARDHHIDAATMSAVSPGMLVDLLDNPRLDPAEIQLLGETFSDENLERLSSQIARAHGLDTHFEIPLTNGETRRVSIGQAVRDEGLADQIRVTYRQERSTSRGTRYSTPANILEGLSKLKTLNEVAGLAQSLRENAERTTGYTYRPESDLDDVEALSPSPPTTGPGPSS